MGRVSTVSSGDLATSAFINALVADYLSQTDTTAQSLASNLDIGSKLLLATDLAFKRVDANGFRIRNSSDSSDRDLTARYGNFSTAITVNTIADYSGGITSFSNSVGNTLQTSTLGVGITTLAITTDVLILTGNGGGNNLTTLTGGGTGQRLTIICTDANVTFINDDGHGANTIDLVGAANLAGADDTTLTLVNDGTSWYETSRSVN